MEKQADKVAPVAKETPKAGSLGDAQKFAAPTGRSTVQAVCEVGKTYAISIAYQGEVRDLPFKIPAGFLNGSKAGQSVPTTIASTDANWLGRNAAQLKAHICTSQHGAVAIQPHGVGGVKLNAYTMGHLTSDKL